ncbi:hypothetical protein Trydic_g19590 [Trypoxylus dichotomus]
MILTAPETVDEYRLKVRTGMEKAKPKQIRQNISRTEQRSLKELMSDKNNKILPADEGNSTVIMDVGIYNIKIKEIINAGKYEEPKENSTASVESNIQQTLNKYKSDLSNQLSWQKLTLRYTKPPHLCGVLKIHKPDTPPQAREILRVIHSPNSF